MLQHMKNCNESSTWPQPQENTSSTCYPWTSFSSQNRFELYISLIDLWNKINTSLSIGYQNTKKHLKQFIYWKAFLLHVWTLA